MHTDRMTRHEDCGICVTILSNGMHTSESTWLITEIRRISNELRSTGYNIPYRTKFHVSFMPHLSRSIKKNIIGEKNIYYKRGIKYLTAWLLYQSAALNFVKYCKFKFCEAFCEVLRFKIIYIKAVSFIKHVHLSFLTMHINGKT